MRFSVVINTYNRAHSLKTTLEALAYQTYQDFEVVVVNGPSTDKTAELLAEWSNHLVVADCPAVNISMSRNIGINNASGDVVAYIDDDAIPEPNWLEQLAVAYEQENVGGAGGLVWDHTGMELQYRFSLCDHLGRTEFVQEQPEAFPNVLEGKQFIYLQGTNSSFRRSVLEEVNGFDEEIEYFHDETDLAARIVEQGYRLVPLDCAAVHHKYLASHLRTKERTVLEPYPIVKNSHYFALMNGRNRFPQDEIDAFLQQYTAGVLDHGVQSERVGNMTAEQHAYFVSRVEAGCKEGIARGKSNERKLGQISPCSPENFKHFPTKTPKTKRVAVCFVSNEYPPTDFGGIGRFTRDLAEEMAQEGHQVHVVTKSEDTDKIDWENGVWMHRLAPNPNLIQTPGLESLPYRWNLAHCATVYSEVKRLSDRFELDAVSSPLWASEGLFCQLDDQLPSVTTLMTTQKTLGKIDPSLGNQKLWKQQVALEQASVRHAQNLHAISNSILSKTLEDHGPTSAQAEVCYLGVRDESAHYSRKRDSNRFRVLCVGRLEPRKGTDLLLDAAAELCKAHSDVEFVFVGKDSKEQNGGSFQARFERQHLDLVKQNRVVFSGAVTDEELYQHYADADAFVLPSRFESFGLVLLEAMSFSIPVIAANVGGMTEIVKQGENGLLFSPGESSDLLRCLEQIVSDRDSATEMGRRAREIFEAQWTIAKAAENTADFYARIGSAQRAKLQSQPENFTVADRVCQITNETPELMPLDLETVQKLLQPSDSVLLLKRVKKAWYRPQKKFIAKVFFAILRRIPEPDAVAYFVKRLENGATRKDIVLEIANSPEAQGAGIELDWLEDIPQTEAWESRRIFPVLSLAVGIKSLLDREGPIRNELRRRRQRRKQLQSKKAA